MTPTDHHTEVIMPSQCPGLNLAYLIFDAETIKTPFEPKELEYWTEWAVRGNA